MTKNQIIIFDTTLRDGEQSPGASMSLEEKIKIAHAFQDLGVDVMEAGFPAASQGDFEAVTEISKILKTTTPCGLARALKNDLEKCVESLKHAKNFRIHTFTGPGTFTVSAVSSVPANNNIDYVIPVPQTALITSIKVAEHLKKPLKHAIFKNRYTHRTFINNKNDKIIKNIKKIKIIKKYINNKKILVIDDSIVRGNTSSHLIFLAKKAGAKNIYLASGSPQVLHPNNYGIYIPDREHLIAVNRSNQEIADVIGATKVIYNDLYEIVNCLKRLNPKIDGFEVSMFNGKKIEEINK